MAGLTRFGVAGSVALFAGLALFAERQPYERYQSIVDRQMFGAPPPGFDPTKPPSEVSKADARAAEAQLTKEQEQIRSAIHFSVINVTPSGETAVGFTDNGDAKNPVHYYLKVGEQRNGWLVKEADPVQATMTIAKGDVEVSLSIGGNSAKGGATKSAAAGGDTATASTLPATGAAKPGILVNRQAEGGTQLNSLRSRRLLREQKRQQEAAEREAEQAAAEERRREDEARREEERLQREAEREEQRAQLQQIKEELRKAREEREQSQQQGAEPAPEFDGPPPPPPDFE